MASEGGGGRCGLGRRKRRGVASEGGGGDRVASEGGVGEVWPRKEE